jgi:5'-3' exonuclease
MYGKSIFCWEGESSLEWRKNIYPLYKANRDENKQREEYKVFKRTIPVVKDVLNYYPVKQISHSKAEADDVIFAISTTTNENVIIITTDKDLSQIKNIRSDVIIQNPINKNSIEPSKYIIEEKCIIGDRSDNIPGLYRIGEKTFKKMMEDEKFFKEKMKGNEFIYSSFKKIVDLSLFPKEIHNEIIDTENKTDYNVFIPEEIELFYWNNKLKELLDRWIKVSNSIVMKIKED